ncbi:retrovirus-related pol polyprotein from transposon TNT 1-94 [Tanacetum coccineum]
MSNPTSKPSDASPIKIESPKELTKVSLVNESLKKLKFHIARFDNVVKIRTTPNARTEGEWGFEHTKAVFNNEIVPFLKSLKDIFNVFDRDLLNEIMEVQTVFDQMNAAVQQSSVDKQYVLLNVMNYMSLIGDTVNMDGNRKESCNLEAELLKSQNAFNDLLKSHSQLEKHCISLEFSIQLNQEIFQKRKSSDNQNALGIPEFFENNDLKAQLQDKDSTICKLKDIIKSLREKSKEENVNYDYCEIVTKKMELENSVAKFLSENGRLYNEINHVKQVFKEQFDSIKKTRVRSKEQSDSLIDKLNLKSVENEDLKARIQDKLDLEPLAPKLLQNREAHLEYLKYTKKQADILRGIVKQAKANQPLDKELDFALQKKLVVTPKNKIKKVRFAEPLTSSSNIKQVESSNTSDSNTPILSSIGLKCSTSKYGSKPTSNKRNENMNSRAFMTGNRSQLMNFVSKFLGTVRFGNDHIARIMGYGDYQLGNMTISKKNTCFIRNLEGVDLLFGSRNTNLYTISLDDMLKTSPICLLSKVSKTKSWLWHHQLSYLNFGTINKLAKDGLARGIPRLKFQKDHWCSACALGKSKKSSHQPKAEDTNQEKLYRLHMDLCGPMRVASINRKRYILVIVDDYSRFTWVKFFRTKDEAPEAIIKCIKNIQVRLNATVHNVGTDNGTEFVKQTLCEFYENVGISHQASVARTPQQNGVVKRRNRTLIEVVSTMLIFSKAPLFLWAEAINTSCYTQNHSIIRRRYNKTPYGLMQDKKSDLSFFHVFGALCYPTNDNDDLCKLDAKADIGIFVGYAPAKKAFRIYNKRTQKVIETMYVTFDELTAMASEQFISKCQEPGLFYDSLPTSSSNSIPNPHYSNNLYSTHKR